METALTFLFIGIIALCMVLVYVLRRIAKKQTTLGKILRWWMNSGYRMSCKFPFCGWMAHMIIAVTPEEKAMKARALGQAAEAQDFYGEMIDEAARKEREQQAMEEKIKHEMYVNGYSDVSVNSDGSSATGKDKYGNTHDVDVHWN